MGRYGGSIEQEEEGKKVESKKGRYSGRMKQYRGEGGKEVGRKEGRQDEEREGTEEAQ